MSSSSSSSTSSAKLETSSLYRLTGTNLYSGLDTDSIIKALVSNTQSKIDKQGQLEQIAEWKRDLYRGVTTDMQKFRDTYFSYTSDTNLLSSTFFETADIDSSSDAVSATGDVENAQGLTINSISQIASKAVYNSSQQVSDEAITSGVIHDSWTQSTVGGKSLVVNYNGTDYTLTLSNSVKLDSENMSSDPTAELNKLVSGLNNAVSSNSSLKDKLSFSLSKDNNIVLTATDDTATSLGISAYSTSSDTTTGAAFLKALGLTKTTQTVNADGQIVLTGNNALDTNVNTSALFNQTVSSSSYLTLNGYTVKLGKDIALTGDISSDLGNICKALQSQIDANSNLSGVTVKSEGNALTFTGATVSGGSQNLMKGLNLTAGSSTGTAVTDESALKKSYFGDTLAGNTLTFKLDDVSKTVTFNASDESKYSASTGNATDDVTQLGSYLQDKLTSLFGTDSSGKSKVQVSGTDGTLKFTTTDKTSVLAITSSDSSNVLNECGALRIGYGETNRVETTKTLSELANEVNGHNLQAGTDQKYTISINGKELSFTGDSTLGDVIDQINSDTDMGVTAAYSKTTDTFSIKADDSGSQGKVEFSDVSGTLAATLFGAYDSSKQIAGTDLTMNVTINGQKTDITRSINTTTLDGVNLTVTGTTDTPVTFSSTGNVDDLVTKITDFVNDYNKIIDEVNTLNTESQARGSDGSVSYQPLTDDEKEDMTDDEIEKWNTQAKKGLLQNNDALNGILNDLHTAMTDAVASSGLSLSQLGISTQAYDTTSGGQLVVTTSTLRDTLQKNPDAVTKLFTDDDGISSRVKSALNKYVGTFGGNGVLLQLAGTDSESNDTSQLTTQIKEYQSTITDLKSQLETEEDRYWSKFTAMEQALSTLTSQSDSLTSMFSNSSSSSS